VEGGGVGCVAGWPGVGRVQGAGCIGPADGVEDFLRGFRHDRLGDNAEQGDKIEARADADGGLIDRRFVSGPWRGLSDVFVAGGPDGAGFGCRLAEFHRFVVRDELRQARGDFIGHPGFVLAGFAWLLIKEPQRSATAQVQEALAPIIGRLIKARSYIALMLGMGLGTLSGVSFGFWGPTLFARNHGLTESVASNAFAAYFGLAGLTGMLIFGAVSDRLARKGPHGPPRLAAFSLFFATLCILLVTWSSSFAQSKMLAIPSGLLGGGWSVGVMASLQYLLPDRYRATATATFVAVSTLLGFLVGPWLAGEISGAFGNDAQSLRIGLSVTIPAGFVAALSMWYASSRLGGDNEILRRFESERPD